jgi:hypothetical protein
MVTVAYGKQSPKAPGQRKLSTPIQIENKAFHNLPDLERSLFQNRVSFWVLIVPIDFDVLNLQLHL